MKNNLSCLFLALTIFALSFTVYAQSTPGSKTLSTKKSGGQTASKKASAQTTTARSAKPVTKPTPEKKTTATTAPKPATTTNVAKPSVTETKTALPASQSVRTSANQNSTALPPSQTTQTSQPVTRTTTAQSVTVTPVSTGASNRNTSMSKPRVSYSGAYHKGDKLLNVGVGLSSYYYGNPIGVSFESGIEKDISVGAQLDYNSGNYYGYGRGYKAYYVGARGSIHLTRLLKINVDKLDLYAGLGLGYRHFSWNDVYYGSNGGLFMNYFIGGKYYFTGKIGAFTELGYTGLSSARIGLAVKF